jgi:hypothetical protein
MRFNFRIVRTVLGKKITFFLMLSTTQTLHGVMSKLSNGKHYLFFDLEKTTLKDVKDYLGIAQNIFGLSNIYIVSDKEGSYRAYCFNQVTFYQWLHIITFLPEKMVDWSFIFWSTARGQATLRTAKKIGREKQHAVAVLESYYLPIPEKLAFVEYDTGIHKQGINILLGEK